MNIDSVLERLMPLFEKKVAWQMEKEYRDLSFRERLEDRKVELEYRKLDSWITDSKDRLAFEKEKLAIAHQNSLDLTKLQQSGAMDLKLLENKGLLERDKQSGEYRILETALAHGTKTETTKDGEVTVQTSSNPYAEKLLQEKMGSRVAAPPGAPSAQTAEQDAAHLRDLVGNPAALKAAYESLNPQRRKEVDAIRTASAVNPIVAPAPIAAPAPVSAAPITGQDLNNVSAEAPATIGTPPSPQEYLNKKQEAWRRSNVTSVGTISPLAILNSPMDAAKARERDAQAYERQAAARKPVQSFTTPSLADITTPGMTRPPLTADNIALANAEEERKKKEAANKLSMASI